MNPQKNRKIEDNKSRGVRMNKTVALLVLFCLCIGGISLVSARYIKETKTDNNSAAAEEFYFESDLLDRTTHEVVATEENGATASVTIRLKNYVDELRYSDRTIDYTVAVTEEESNTSVPDNNIENKTGTIATGDCNYKDVTLKELQAGKSYTVTATTNNAYQKTLTGTIKVAGTDDKVYASISDRTEYIEVTVWTTDYEGTVTLTYADIGLVPDNTDTKMNGQLSTGGTITENNWKANTSHVFRFFKNDTAKKYQVATDDNKEVTVSAK